VAADVGFTFPADGLDLGQAGGWVLNPIGAMLSLRDAARLREGETLLVTAGAGGFGCASIQVGRLLGAGRIIAIASTPEKRAFALAQGADEAIGYDDPVPPIDVLLDTVGGTEGWENRLDAVRQLGRVMVMGKSGGIEPPVPPNAWLKERNVTAVVFSWGAVRRHSPDLAKERAREVIELVLAGKVRLPVEEVVAFEGTADAYRRILARETMGKVVIHPAATS
jgi:NADPH2:quinone reductase